MSDQHPGNPHLLWPDLLTIVPAPHVLDARGGWLLLAALPGIPLHQTAVWGHRPHDVVKIVAAALRSLALARVTHGDMCLPNILGDPAGGRLTGIVDWRYAGRFGREIDVAAAVWSCGFNGHGDDVAVAVLRAIGRPAASVEEVRRLGQVWRDLTMPEDSAEKNA